MELPVINTEREARRQANLTRMSQRTDLVPQYVPRIKDKILVGQELVGYKRVYVGAGSHPRGFTNFWASVSSLFLGNDVSDVTMTVIRSGLSLIELRQQPPRQDVVYG